MRSVAISHALVRMMRVRIAGMWIAQYRSMKRQAKGALLAFAFVAAFIAAVAFKSVIAAVIVLLSGVTVAYVVGIAWMRTSTHRVRSKDQSKHSLP